MGHVCGHISRRILLRNLSNRGQFSIAGYGSVAKNPTAGLIIIGDEILKAQVQDTNSYFICSSLYSCGVRVRKISVIGDDVDEIADEIIKFSKHFTYVITSGGIGPTHDDVTFQAVAKAFDDSLHYHPTLVEIVKKFSTSQNISSPSFKLAYIPTSASLMFGTDRNSGQMLSYPCVHVKNVFVFPGSPTFLRKSFGNLYEELFTTDVRFFTEEVFINAREETFADALTAVSKEFPNVTFGSYPTMHHSYYHARVTIESVDGTETKKAVARFKELAPSGAIVNYDSDPIKDARKKFEKLVASDSQGSLYQSTFSSVKIWYDEPATVAVYFDGSIESIVLLHLAYVAVDVTKLRAVCFKSENSFPEVDDFMKDTADRYELDFHVFEGSEKQNCEKLARLWPEMKTLLVGSRTDNVKKSPWTGLLKNGNVNGVRIESPIRDWTYRDVWKFARSLSLPYCKLYDRGYTSLGNPNDTAPDPSLKRSTFGRTEYDPAYMLRDT